MTRLERARLAAVAYREAGYNPLPSCPVERRPALKTYSDERDNGVHAFRLEPGKWHAENVQLACGKRWDLVVIDLDGPRAREVWSAWCHSLGWERTWCVGTPRGGLHLWYSCKHLPEMRKSILWKDGEKHSMIELLAESSLAIAPPSHRVIDGEVREYTLWKFGDRPAPLPRWVYSMTLARPAQQWTPPVPKLPPVAREKIRERHYDLTEVQAALVPEQRVELARSWGLRFACRGPNPKGWMRCHALDRVDSNPSASFDVNSGTYKDNRDGTVLPFFRLAEHLGAYRSWSEACDDVGARVIPWAAPVFSC